MHWTARDECVCVCDTQAHRDEDLSLEDTKYQAIIIILLFRNGVR